MTANESTSGGQGAGVLSVDGQPATPSVTPSPAHSDVTGRFQAVINVHDQNLHQIEVAIEANRHATDPHPARPGEFVSRHPVLLACFDPSQHDDQGRPLPGQPAELDLDTIRQIYSKRYSHVSPDAPPADGSHVSVPGMHTIAELDSTGTPTGRVMLGSPTEPAS